MFACRNRRGVVVPLDSQRRRERIAPRVSGCGRNVADGVGFDGVVQVIAETTSGRVFREEATHRRSDREPWRPRRALRLGTDLRAGRHRCARARPFSRRRARAARPRASPPRAAQRSRARSAALLRVARRLAPRAQDRPPLPRTQRARRLPAHAREGRPDRPPQRRRRRREGEPHPAAGHARARARPLHPQRDESRRGRGDLELGRDAEPPRLARRPLRPRDPGTLRRRGEPERSDWRRLNGSEQLGKLLQGFKFVDGITQEKDAA